MVDILNGSAAGVGSRSSATGPDLKRIVAPPAFSRFLRNVLIVFGALSLLAVILVVVRDTKYSPTAAVDGYLTALEERDSKAAVERLVTSSAQSRTTGTLFGQTTTIESSPNQVNSPLAQSAVLTSADYSPPSGHKVTKVETNGNSATVTATMTIGGVPTTMIYHLVRESASLSKVFRPWRIINGLETMAVSWPYGMDVVVGGQRLATQEGYVGAAAYPGTYTVSTTSAVLDSSPITVPVTQSKPDTLPRFSVSLKATAIADVTAQVQSLVATCAQKPSLAAEGCPFAAQPSGSGTYSNVVWTVTAAPTFEVSIQPEYVAVQTKQQGSAALTCRYTDTSGRLRECSTVTDTFDVDGYVTDNGGKVVFNLS